MELDVFGFIGFSRAGHFLMACSPKRMLLAPVLVGIALGRNVFSRRALALFIRIWISGHNLFFPAEPTLPDRNCWLPNRQCPAVAGSAEGQRPGFVPGFSLCWER
jgi:hypothetical protein